MLREHRPPGVRRGLVVWNREPWSGGRRAATRLETLGRAGA